jgi:hypothetical protein
MRQRRALGPESWMAGGDSTMVSRTTEERERAWGPKIAKCRERESVGPKILG